jgi:hypothetical protein
VHRSFRQLFQSMLWFTLRQQAAPAALRLSCWQSALLESQQHKVSRTQLDVPDAIRLLPGCSGAISEHGTDDNLFSIDIALQLPGDQKLPVEVDGPDLSNTPCPRRDAPAQPMLMAGVVLPVTDEWEVPPGHAGCTHALPGSLSVLRRQDGSQLLPVCCVCGPLQHDTRAARSCTLT